MHAEALLFEVSRVFYTVAGTGDRVVATYVDLKKKAHNVQGQDLHATLFDAASTTLPMCLGYTPLFDEVDTLV